MMTDTIADMISRLKNAVMVGHERVDIPGSKTKAAICKVLKEEGFIRSFKIRVDEKSRVQMRVYLKDGAITGISKISRSGLRVYKGYDELPRVRSGLGMSIVSTSKGVLSSRKAKSLKVGGEVLCAVW